MASKTRPILPGEADLDVDILREMYPSRGVELSGVDPRLNASRVSRRLGISRARVAARLRAWTEFGFVRRFDVWPNPHLFGLTGTTFDVRVADRLRKPSVIERLGLVPGAVVALDYAGEWMGFTCVFRLGEDPNRIGALLRGLADVSEVGPAVPWGVPDVGRPLSPLDLRILRVLRQFPTDTLASIARHVGVSTRTITGRYGRLLDERSAWFLPVFDFRALAEPAVSVGVQCRSVADRVAFGRALHHEYPRSIEFHRTPFGPVLEETFGYFFVLARSAARVEELESWVRDFPGVERHEAVTMIRMVSFPETFDRIVGEVEPLSEKPAPRKAPP